MEHFSNQGKFIYVVDAAYDSLNMGLPVSSLSAVTDIVLQFKATIVPLGTKVSDGEIAMVVNNRVTVKFAIPAQTIEHKDTNTTNTVLMLHDVQKQMERIIKPPSE